MIRLLQAHDLVRILAGLTLLAPAGLYLCWQLAPRYQNHGARDARIWLRRGSAALHGSLYILPFWTRLSGVVLALVWEEPSCGPCSLEVENSYLFPSGRWPSPVAFRSPTNLAGDATLIQAPRGPEGAWEIGAGVWWTGDERLRERLLAEEFRKRAVLQAMEEKGSRLSLRSGQAVWEFRSKVDLSYHGPRILEKARKLAQALQA